MKTFIIRYYHTETQYRCGIVAYSETVRGSRDAAVNTAVAVLLLLIQFLQVRRYKSEHRPHLLFPYLKNQL